MLTLRLQPVGPRTDAAAYNRNYYTQVFEQIAAVPGVDAVGAVQHLPLSGSSWNADLEIEGRPLAGEHHAGDDARRSHQC